MVNEIPLPKISPHMLIEKKSELGLSRLPKKLGGIHCLLALKVCGKQNSIAASSEDHHFVLSYAH